MTAFVFAAVLGAAVPGAAIQDAPNASSRLVVTVTDSDGRLVGDLDAEDFLLEVDGKGRAITEFTPDSEAPISLGILIDRSGSMGDLGSGVFALNAARGTTKVLLDLLRPGDEFLLMSFTSGPSVEQEWTEDRDEIRERLRRFDPSGDTNLLGSLGRALEEMMKARYRTRALIVLTDAHAEGEDLERVGLEVLRAEIPVYAFGIHIGRPFTPGSPTDPQILETLRAIAPVLSVLASSSGGRATLLQIHGEKIMEDMVAFIREIEASVRGQYTIGYAGEEGERGLLRAIRIRAVNPAYHASIRPTP